MNLAGAIITLLGSIVILIAAIGLLRMPDTYTRIQVSTKATTLGTIMSMIGLLLVVPEWWGKLVLLTLFIMITNPVSSHVLARAAHYIKIPFTNSTVVDKLKLSSETQKVEVDDSNASIDEPKN